MVNLKKKVDYSTLRISQLLELDNSILTIEEANQLDENSQIETCENCGLSGYKIGYIWFVYTLRCGEEINIYI